MPSSKHQQMVIQNKNQVIEHLQHQVRLLSAREGGPKETDGEHTGIQEGDQVANLIFSSSSISEHDEEDY